MFAYSFIYCGCRKYDNVILYTQRRKSDFHGEGFRKTYKVKGIMLHYPLSCMNISTRKLHKSQEKINHLMYIDDITLFSQNEKELQTIEYTTRI